MAMAKILVIEDDRSICEMINNYLTGEDFSVAAFYDGKAAMENFLADKKYDLVLVDLMLPGVNGMDIIRQIRTVSTVPIIIITAKDSDTDKSMGLNLGADDYVVKPFSLIELTARIKANIRRAAQYDGKQEEAVIHFKNLKINTDKHTVTQDGAELELTRTEFDILYLLASNPGKTFSKEQLYQSVWKEPYYGNENVLNTHINRLRTKLKKRILKNLIDNAIKHGGSGKYLAISLKNTHEGVVIEITDHGHGIEKEHQELIFMRNFATGKASGSGLGLTISQSLALQMGAEIQVTSVPEQKTVFSLHLKK